MLRLAYVELFASPSFSTDRLYHMADLLASNSAALIILLCVNIIYVRHTRRRTRHGLIAEIAAFLLFVLLTSACVALITGLHLPFAFDRSFTAREFLQLWIITLLVEVILYSVVFMVDYALVARAVLRAERGKAHQAQFRYMKLKQQVNPHFLFNSLNILDCLVCEQRTEQASVYIHKLAGIYRYMLQNEEETLVRLHEEMAFVGMYVDLLQVRFPEGFRVETDISDEVMNRHVLPCSVQLLIENAIKHNSVGADRPLVIRIVAEAEAVTVSNNLQLKVSGNPSTRVGLSYILKQYLDLSGIPIGIRRTATEYCVTLPLLLYERTDRRRRNDGPGKPGASADPAFSRRRDRRDDRLGQGNGALATPAGEQCRCDFYGRGTLRWGLLRDIPPSGRNGAGHHDHRI